MFFPGNEVRCITPANSAVFRNGGAGWKPGYVFTVHKITTGNDERGDIVWPIEGGGVYSKFLELTNKKGVIMNLKENFALLLKSEPEKSFRKVGLTNGDDLLTEDGQSVFLTWLLKQNGEQFKKDVVDPILAEEAKKD